MARDIWGNNTLWGPGPKRPPKRPPKKPKPVRNPILDIISKKNKSKPSTGNKTKGVYPKAFTPIDITGKPLKFKPRRNSVTTKPQVSQIPDGYYERMAALKKKAQRAQAAKSRARGGSGGGGSGGSGGGSTTPPKDKKKKKEPTPGKPSTPAKHPEFDINTLFDPARKAIANQRIDIQQRRDASMKAWNDFNAWAEQKRAESAGLVTQANAEQTRLVNENRAAADARIAELVQGARGQGAGAAVAGGDLGQATGADAMAQSQATLGAGEQANADWSALQGRVANQRMETQQQINNALAAEGQRNVELGTSRAFAQNDKDLASLENAVAAAKLDQYNRDRSYELDKQAAAWLRTYQQKGLDLQGRQLDAQAAAAQASAAKDEWDRQFEMLKESNAQARKTGDTLVDARKMTVDLSGDFKNMDPHEQGQVMQEVGRALRATYGGILEAQEASRIMASVFGRRYTDPKFNGAQGGRSAIQDFARIWGS